MRIVAFTGPKGCGKDTAAKGLLDLNQKHRTNFFHRQMMAGPAKAIAAMAFGLTEEQIEDRVLKETVLERFPYLCPRQLVIDVANWYRDQYSGHVWAHAWERIASGKANKWGCFVITDIRFPEEIEMLRRHDSILIYVNRREAEEELAKKQAAGDKLAQNVSESHYGLLYDNADAVVENNNEVYNLHNEVISVVRNHFDYWGHWPEVTTLNAQWEKDRIGREQWILPSALQGVSE